MKNQSPIKRHPAIVSFSKDHHFGLLFVWKIRQGLKNGIEPARIADYVQFFFRADLEKHFQDEEALLFSHLPAADPLRLRAEEEHRRIYGLVGEIGSRKDEPALLNELADVLDGHIRFEERELFNHLQETLGSAELEEIEKRMTGHGEDVDACWQDVFWERI